MLTVYRDEQVDVIRSKLRLPKSQVEKVLVGYVAYLKREIEKGRTVKFLNICYLRVGDGTDKSKETLAYISNELARELSYGKESVYAILNSFEETIISDVSRFYTYTIRGLVKITLSDYMNTLKVRVKKSTVYNNERVRVITIGSFKRKVEGYDR